MTDSPEPNDIDTLMALDPLELSRQDLDRIILYQRKQRAAREAGVRTKKPRGEAKPAVSIEALLSNLPKAAPTGPAMKRRF
jgi:hypothetical protein